MKYENFILILSCAALTFALRWAPMLGARRFLRSELDPRIRTAVTAVGPAALASLLVVHFASVVEAEGMYSALPLQALGLLVAAVTQRLRRNLGLSILSGSLTYAVITYLSA